MVAPQTPEAWRLLIYTVPSEPSRKRAYVWRELKKAGAVYLRDGVCALPEQTEAVEALAAIADKIEEFGGEAIVVPGANLPPARAQAIIDASRVARGREYVEIAEETEGFLRHIRRETEHREFTFSELEELEIDLNKLRVWLLQVKARDYFAADGDEHVVALLAECNAELNAFMERASSFEAGR